MMSEPFSFISIPGRNFTTWKHVEPSYPIGSMVLYKIYMVCHGSHQQKPQSFFGIFLPAPTNRIPPMGIESLRSEGEFFIASPLFQDLWFSASILLSSYHTWWRTSHES